MKPEVAQTQIELALQEVLKEADQTLQEVQKETEQTLQEAKPEELKKKIKQLQMMQLQQLMEQKTHSCWGRIASQVLDAVACFMTVVAIFWTAIILFSNFYVWVLYK